MIFLFSLEALAILLQIFEAAMFQDGFIGSALLIILYYDFVIEIESKYDKLSGVGSTTYFNSYIDRIRKKCPCALLMFDVNGLKHTNDTLGHEAGDKLIKEVGQSIKDAVSSNGKVFRTGGDEFMAVLSTGEEGCGKEILEKTEEILRRKTDELGMQISAASGITIWQANEDIQDAKKRVDKAMYASKKWYYQQYGNDRRGSERNPQPY